MLDHVLAFGTRTFWYDAWAPYFQSHTQTFFIRVSFRSKNNCTENYNFDNLSSACVLVCADGLCLSNTENLPYVLPQNFSKTMEGFLVVHTGGINVTREYWKAALAFGQCPGIPGANIIEDVGVDVCHLNKVSFSDSKYCCLDKSHVTTFQSLFSKSIYAESTKDTWLGTPAFALSVHSLSPPKMPSMTSV